MYFKALTHIVCLPLLLIVIVSATTTCIGKLSSHGVISATQISFTHSHSATHSHDLEDQYQSHHDASNHKHDSDSFSAINSIAIVCLSETITSRQMYGSPGRLPCRIDRPPKIRLSA